MTEYSNQRTLNGSISICGKGLHTGQECRVTLHPAAIDSGISFRIGNSEIRANVSNVFSTQRGTSLGNDEITIHTVEHLLSALAGMCIDNALIEVTGVEIPIMDGSALPFVQAIDQVGVCPQDAPARSLKLRDIFWVIDGNKCVSASPFDSYRMNILMSYDHPLIGEQGATFDLSPEIYREKIAPARTFCTSEEIGYILSQGLGLGGDESNVIIAYDDGYSIPLRFENELVRHKLLDMIGDLSLTGCRISADVFGLRTGHSINSVLASMMIENNDR